MLESRTSLHSGGVRQHEDHKRIVATFILINRMGQGCVIYELRTKLLKWLCRNLACNSAQ